MGMHAPAPGGGLVKKQRPGEYACIGLDLEHHERADAAGAAMATWTWGLLYSRGRELDGFVPAVALKRAWVGERQARRDLGTLVKVGLAVVSTHSELGDGWTLLRYQEWNDTREELEQRRASWASKKREERTSYPRNDRRNSEMSRETTVGTFGGTPLNSSLSDLDSDLRKELEEGKAARPAPPEPAASKPPEPTAPPPAEDGRHGPDPAPDDPREPPGPSGASTARLGGRDEPLDEPPRELHERPRGVRPFHVRRYEQPYYAQAYADGAVAVTGAAYVVPRDELAALDDAIDGHAPGEPHEIRDEWVRSSAEAFRRAIRGREQYHRNGGPRGWLEWLGIGAPNAEWLAMTPAQREAHTKEQQQRARAAARRARDAAKPKPPTEAPITAEHAAETLARLFGGPMATQAKTGT